MSNAPDWFAIGVMVRLCSAFPSWPCNAGTIQVFWEVLADIPRAEIERATVTYIATETAWPIAASLRKLAQKPSAEEAMTAGEAWDELYHHRHLHTRHPKWSSDAVRRAAEAVGWNDPGWLAEALPTIRAQFERYFLAVQKRGQRERVSGDGARLLELSTGARIAGEPRKLFGGSELPR